MDYHPLGCISEFIENELEGKFEGFMLLHAPVSTPGFHTRQNTITVVRIRDNRRWYYNRSEGWQRRVLERFQYEYDKENKYNK